MFDDKDLPLWDKYYLRDNYKFVCLCRSFSKGYCCAF